MRQGNRLRWLWACLLVVLSAGSIAWGEKARDGNAGAKPKEEVVPLGPDVTPPRLVHQVQPRYVPGSRGVRVVGVVVVEFVVGSDGMPNRVRVVRSLDKDVDQSAVDAVQQWRFEPAKKAGKSVAVKLSAEIRFNEM